MINIPSQQTKKWLTSFKGDFWGNLINMFNLDLFSSQGRAKVGGKMYPQTTESEVTGITPPSDFTTAEINDGGAEPFPKKVWAVADNKKILRSEDGAEFEEDAATGLSADENTNTNSDLISVPDDSGEPISVIEVSIGTGTGAFGVTGEGNNEMWAQSFKAGGPVSELAWWARAVGSPADNYIVSIQEDDGSGDPDGTPLISITLPATDLTSSFAEITKAIADFTPTSLQLDISKTYWMVFERSGSADTENYVQFMLVIGDEDDDPYDKGTIKNFNGSTWERTIVQEVTDSFTADGTWTCPAGVTEAIVECWAAGGNGTVNAGGGGGGAYSRKTVTVVPTTGYAVVVGEGGGAAGADGEDSTFDTTTVVAKGGKGQTAGGAGGAASGGTGDVKYSGGNASQGTGNRGGGGGAGQNGDGGNGSTGAGGQGGNDNGGSGGWQAAAPFDLGGGGGSGAANVSEGARGEVRITYYKTATANYANVVGRTFGRDLLGADSQSHDVEIPLSLPGELLILIITLRGNQSSASASGWTLLEDVNIGTTITQSIFYKYATGNDDTTVVSPTSKQGTWVVYRIANGAVPTATQTQGNSTNADPPSHTTDDSANYLWITSMGIPMDNSSEDITAPPAGYGSFIGINGNAFVATGITVETTRMAVADKQAAAQTENPGAYTSTDAQWVASTIAVGYEALALVADASISVTVEFPSADERLYLTTTKDVKFLNEEDGIWQSLWQGIFGQDPLQEDYPHPMVELEAGGIIFVGDGHLLHSMIATGNTPSEANPNRLIFPSSHYINWIVLTKSAVFIGLANKKSDLLPSFICYYEPFSEVTRIFNVEEGTTMGWEQDENCFIIDKSGQMRYYNGSDFRVYDYFPPYYNNPALDKMNLPHRNGIVYKDSIVHFLWEGQYPYPAGIWTYDEQRLYHRWGFVFDQVNLNSFGAVDPAPSIAWKALYFSIQGWLAGAAVDNDNLDPVQGIFSSYKTAATTVESDNRSNFKTVKFQSPQIDNIWQRVFAKIEDRPDGPVAGSVILKQRYQMSPIGEGYNAPAAFTGLWTSSTTFTTNTAAFVSAVDAGNIVVGDEIIVRTGLGAGMLAHITAISGTTTKTVTIDSGLADISTGDFTFSVENWRVIANRGLTGNQTGKQWLQVKVEVRDYVEVTELQVGSKVNRTNEE